MYRISSLPKPLTTVSQVMGLVPNFPKPSLVHEKCHSDFVAYASDVFSVYHLSPPSNPEKAPKAPQNSGGGEVGEVG
ncbi:hypothetical protein DMENIID0001_122600 [Sergentomyia squamirostris]